MITCAHTVCKNTFFGLRTFRKSKDDLANTTYKYDTQYSGNCSNIHNGVGDQYHINSSDRYGTLIGMPSLVYKS